MSEQTTFLTLLLILFLVLSNNPLVSASEDSWTTLEPMPTARMGFGVAVVDGKIFAIGGSNGSYLDVNEMYDPETNTWTTKASMPTARSGFGVAVVQNKIYVIGGVKSRSSFLYSGYTGVNEVYDPKTDMWETLEPMTVPRSSLCANVVDEKIYLIEGRKYSDLGPAFSQVPFVTEVYDPANDSWSTRTAIPDSIFGYSSAVVEKKIYLFGHHFPGSNVSTQIYDTEMDTWSLGTSVPQRVVGSAAVITTGELAPQRIYVLGGNTGIDAGTDYNQVYDPETDDWATGVAMPTARYGLAVAVVNDELYAIGGRTTDTYLATNEKYTPANYIPEFPSWVVLPLILTITLFFTIVKRNLCNSHENASVFYIFQKN